MTENTIAPSGVLVIDKPVGVTSHDVVRQIRQLIARGLPAAARHWRAKVGHTGTLDPFATGVLLVLVGSATRLAEYAHAASKVYEACVMLGARSTTDDPTGIITPQLCAVPPSRAVVQQVVRSFTGRQTQLPPHYAAIKVRGKKLYEYARQGVAVERSVRLVHIEAIDLLAFDYPQLIVRVRCGSGTYLRALGRDIGQALQTGGYVSALRRVAIGKMTVEQAAALTELTARNWTKYLLPSDILVAHLPRLTLAAVNVAQLRQGRAVSLPPPRLGQAPQALFDEHGELFGIGQWDERACALLPHKIL